MKLITTTARLNNGVRIRLGGPPSFERRQMLSLGQFSVSQVKARVARGVGSDDSPMKALKPSYVKFKSKIGRGNQRDLKLTGQMLGAFNVRYADAKQVRMDITTQHGRDAARGNERRTPWYGFSRFDEAAIYRRAQSMFKQSVANFAVRLRGGSPRATAWANAGGWNADAPGLDLAA